MMYEEFRSEKRKDLKNRTRTLPTKNFFSTHDIVEITEFSKNVRHFRRGIFEKVVTTRAIKIYRRFGLSHTF